MLHQSLCPCLSLSLSLYFWLIPWSAKASFVTQGILASFLLSLSHHQLRTTRFRSIKGPQQVDSLVLSFPRTVRELGLRLRLSSKISACRARDTGDESSISGLGRFPGGRHGNSLQHSCLEIPWAEEPGGPIVHGVVRAGHT